MTVLSVGAERAQMERASVFSTTSLSLPELKGTEKGCIWLNSDVSKEVMDDGCSARQHTLALYTVPP